jgi:succinoglycan biosynthesis transport protein ExoP
MNRESQPITPAQQQEGAEPELGELVQGLAYALLKHRWYVLGCFALATVGASQVAMRMPNRYKSEASIGVVQQQISEKYVASDVVPINELITSLRQQILSSGSLAQMVDELDLYRDMKNASTEDLVARMEKDLSVDIAELRRDEIRSFSVSFVHPDPKVAQRVVQKVVGTFFNETSKSRDTQLQTTDTFLDDEVKRAEAKLAEQEARLVGYKSRNLNQLPEQQGSNAVALADIRSRLRNVGPEMDRARRGLRQLEMQVTDKLARLQADRADLMRRYTAANLRVVKTDSDIANYFALREMFGPEGLSAKSRQLLAGGEDPQVSQIRSQAEEYNSDLDRLKRDEVELEAQVRDYQSRVAAAPLREQEQIALQRDYKLLQEDYEALKAKQIQAGLTKNLEGVDRGQRFRVIEPASLPRHPDGPNRLKLTLAGAGGGLAFGAVLALVLGMGNKTFRSEKEVAAAYVMPLVLGIPEILTPGEQNKRSRQKVIEWMGAVALILCVISTEVYIYLKG